MSNEDRIIDYLHGSLSMEDRLRFETDLEKDHVLKSEFVAYQELFQELETVKMETPSVTLKANFESLLSKEMEKNEPKGGTSMAMWRNWAAVAAILVIGILVGQTWTQRNMIDRQTNAIVAEMKKSMDTESVTGRIEALQVSLEVQQPDLQILNTLIHTLENDESPNVRLAAAEALDKYAEEEVVRTAFVQQLSEEKDPFVLIALINSLSDQKVEKAIDPLQNLTTAEDVAKFIKDEAHLGLIKIEKI